MSPQAQGSYSLFAMQYEEAFGVSPVVPDLTKIYFESVSIKSDQKLIDSNVMTGTRNPTKPGLGNIDVKGDISTELQAYIGMLLYGSTGSIKTTLIGTGEAVGTALTTPTAVIDPFNQTLTVSATAHGLLVGNVVQVAAITAPVALNSMYLRVIAIPTANTFVCRIPLGISGAFTTGAGTIKKVTTPATAYQHEMKAGGALPSFVGETGFADLAQYFLFKGIKIGSMSIGVTPEGFQKLSFNLTGASETLSGTSFDSTANDLTKVSFTGFMVASIIEDVGGANNTLGTVSGLDISLENNLDDAAGYVVGSQGKRTSLPVKRLKLSGTLTVQFDSITLYNKATAGTETSLKVLYNQGTGAGTAGNESLEITISELMFSRSTPTIDSDGGIMIKLPIVAYYDNHADATSVKIILKNTQPGP